LSAIAYRPNNWDSMTYHLARVVYWIENRSVGAFTTNNPRQVVLPPGAEYVLLALQVITGTDAFANFLQFGAWLLMVGSASTVARSCGGSRQLARWAPLVVGAAPMAILQASSTQNDLVASAMTIAMVFACLPFLHLRRPRWRAIDVVWLLIAVTAGLLV